MAKIITTEEFIQDCKSIHKNRYDYSKVKYKTARDLITIICPIHGEFKQKAYVHKAGSGCSLCGVKLQKEKVTLSTDEFIQKSQSKHPEYDYSKVVYINAYTKVEVVCPEHGSFWTVPTEHSSNRKNGKKIGCPKCGNIRKRSSPEKYIEQALMVHGDKYDYSKTVYKHSRKKVSITCPIHGEFKQMPLNHTINGEGCPSCSNTGPSKPQLEINEFINNIGFKTELDVKGKLKGNKELDIYIPSKQFAIEHNGLRFHNDEKVPRKYHLEKTVQCEAQGIQLFHIFGDEWLNENKKKIIKSMIKNKLGQTDEKYYARKCEIIRDVDKRVKTEFLNRNHVQGDQNNSKIHYFLYHKGMPVACMTFSPNHMYEWELTRFCNALNTIVVGGAGKLLKAFRIDYNPKHIVSYADRRWTRGNMYEKLNFKKMNESSPYYTYIPKGEYKRLHCKGFAKSRLKERFQDYNDEPEGLFMRKKGYSRIYDCGKIRYEWKLE